ncbi:pyroglutamyl-peptidase 1 isoform 3-T4 [Dama dama]|uniref:pyroglutamyl-peptidase 1 isoform X3 n=1 Tax=Dama dama TaxID=30532 RepID=UPI002A364736|nr:pyroglutamyl-peptidase 1 isoform X3 [Dama dama]XP_061005802.1 pyroglutamyl-peptidase 1 isoform X3 [Dama dama]
MCMRFQWSIRQSRGSSLPCGRSTVPRRSLCYLVLLVYGGPGNSLIARHPVADKAAQELLITQLVVHVGVSGMATAVTLEKCGHNKGYKGLDNCRFCPGSHCCVEDGPESIDSIIDMDAVCERVTTLGLDVSVTISQDAGRYLCDFTYYTSLYQSHGRSAFVHVPPLGKPYNADQLGRALRAIIEEMLDLLEQSEGKINCCHEH